MYLDLFRLDGKTALITGATRGIGLGIAEAMGEAGAHLILSSKNPKPEVIKGLKDKGFKVDYIQADMEDAAAPAKLVAEALKLGGKIDILVNNAGVAAHGDTHSFTPDRYRKIMTTNLDSLFLCCQAVIEPMKKAGGGVILNIGSISGLVANVPQPQAAYNASKAAVHMFTKSLASDYALDNIRANAIAPGYIDTDMTSGGLADPVWSPIWKQMTPMGRAGTVAEIATASLFLCSPAASYVTGAVLVIDGGYTAR